MRGVVVQIEGVKEALAALNDIDKKYRRQVTKRIKAAGDQIIQEARSMVSYYDNSEGNGAPLSGMVRGSLIQGREITWRTDQVQKGFKVRVGVRPTRERYVNFNRSDEYGNKYTEQVPFGALPYRLMVIQQADAAGAIYDHAGRNKQSGFFVQNLNAEVGPQPRAIDKAVENNRPAVVEKVEDVLKDVERMTNRQLRRR
jgi:hypothetical protein